MVHADGGFWNKLKNFGRKVVGGVKKAVPKVINVVKKVGGAVSKFVGDGDMDKVIKKADDTWQKVKPLLPEQVQQGGERVRKRAIDVTDKGRYLVSKFDRSHQPMAI